MKSSATCYVFLGCGFKFGTWHARGGAASGAAPWARLGKFPLGSLKFAVDGLVSGESFEGIDDDDDNNHDDDDEDDDGGDAVRTAM